MIRCFLPRSLAIVSVRECYSGTASFYHHQPQQKLRQHQWRRLHTPRTVKEMTQELKDASNDGNGEKCCHLMDVYCESGKVPTLKHHNLLIRSFSRIPNVNISAVRLLMKRMRRNGMEPNGETYRHFFKGCFNAHTIEGALKEWEQMIVLGDKVYPSTYFTALRLFAANGNAEVAHLALEEVNKAKGREKIKIIGQSLVIKAYASRNNTDAATRLLKDFILKFSHTLSSSPSQSEDELHQQPHTVSVPEIAAVFRMHLSSCLKVVATAYARQKNVEEFNYLLGLGRGVLSHNDEVEMKMTLAGCVGDNTTLNELYKENRDKVTPGLAKAYSNALVKLGRPDDILLFIDHVLNTGQNKQEGSKFSDERTRVPLTRLFHDLIVSHDGENPLNVFVILEEMRLAGAAPTPITYTHLMRHSIATGSPHLCQELVKLRRLHLKQPHPDEIVLLQQARKATNRRHRT
eukprot:m.46138 g.46138  ORF g.46138 m.46138 type:complete len:461 (+) comp10711_c0_seq1:40-1422(+)